MHRNKRIDTQTNKETHFSVHNIVVNLFASYSQKTDMQIKEVDNPWTILLVTAL